MGYLTHTEISERNMIYKLDEPTEWQKRRFIYLTTKLMDSRLPNVLLDAPEEIRDNIFNATKRYYENEILGNTERELR